MAARKDEHGKPAEVGVLLRIFDWNSGGAAEDTVTPAPGEGLYARVADDITHTSLPYVDLLQAPPAMASLPKSRGYLPFAFSFDSRYGNQEELAGLIHVAGQNGIGVVGDVVSDQAVAKRYPLELGPYTYARKHHLPFGLTPECIYADRGGTGSASKAPGLKRIFPGPAELDHSNPTVRGRVRRRLGGSLEGFGIVGYRTDFAVGIAPEHAREELAGVDAPVRIAEHWFDYDPNDLGAHRSELQARAIKGNTAVYDVTTMAALREAMKGHSVGPNGETAVDTKTSDLRRLVDRHQRPAGLNGIAPELAVLVVENHDTGPSTNRHNETHATAHGQQHWPMAGVWVAAGYAYTLLHPALGAEVYAPHYFDWQSHGDGPHRGKKMRDELTQLFKLRKEAGIGPESTVEVLSSKKGLYAARIDGPQGGSIFVKLGWEDWSPDSAGQQGAILAAHGLHYAVWKANEAPTALASIARKLH
ncbi:MAG: hypothetical protein IPL40_01580 [Proteobacteria bacterium]|nr:hypothetical protein [Pseudomonadota bacterium]